MLAIKIIKLCLTTIFILVVYVCPAQSYKLSANGDTLNKIDKNKKRQGKWINRVEPFRGNEGYEEEGMYVDSVKEGYWRIYNLQGDFIALERYKKGGKDGTQLYYTYLGDLEREESWRGYDPNAPYDTIDVYGQGNNEIIEQKIVKAYQYSVKHGQWKWYDPRTGRVIKIEAYDRGMLEKDRNEIKAAGTKDPKEKKKEVAKTPAMLEWEKKNKGKKNAVRDGRTSQ